MHAHLLQSLQMNLHQTILSNGVRLSCIQEFELGGGKLRMGEGGNLTVTSMVGRCGKTSESNYYTWGTVNSDSLSRQDSTCYLWPPRKSSMAGGSMTCKGCTGIIEMQEHCLSVCTGNMQEMRKRHNAIVEQLVKAVPKPWELSSSTRQSRAVVAWAGLMWSSLMTRTRSLLGKLCILPGPVQKTVLPWRYCWLICRLDAQVLSTLQSFGTREYLNPKAMYLIFPCLLGWYSYLHQAWSATKT